jgi:hypothetical protein
MIAQLLQRRPIERHSASLILQLLGTVSDPAQCYASLLLIDAIHVWNQPRNRVSVTGDGSRIAVAGEGREKKSASIDCALRVQPRTRRPGLHNSG